MKIWVERNGIISPLLHDAWWGTEGKHLFARCSSSRNTVMHWFWFLSWWFCLSWNVSNQITSFWIFKCLFFHFLPVYLSPFTLKYRIEPVCLSLVTWPAVHDDSGQRQLVLLDFRILFVTFVQQDGYTFPSVSCCIAPSAQLRDNFCSKITELLQKKKKKKGWLLPLLLSPCCC